MTEIYLERAGKYYEWRIVCRMHNLISLISASNNIFHIAAMATERFIAVTFPLFSRNKVKFKLMKKVCKAMYKIRQKLFAAIVTLN